MSKEQDIISEEVEAFLNQNHDFVFPDIKVELSYIDDNIKHGTTIILCVDDYGEYEIVSKTKYKTTITVED